jgi:starch phosphorylase
LFAGYAIDAIANGVRVPTWTSPAFQVLFDHYISGWREDSFNLRYALSIPPQEVWDAHSRAKAQLINFINRQTNAGFDMYDLTLGFARRAASYKHGDLLFPRRGVRSHPSRLRRQGRDPRSLPRTASVE